MSATPNIVVSVDSVGGGLDWNSTIKLTNASNFSSLPELKISKAIYEMFAFRKGFLVVTEQPHALQYVNENWQARVFYLFPNGDFGLRVVATANIVAVGTNLGHIYFFHVDEGLNALLIEAKKGGHVDRVVSLAASTSGDMMISGSDDKSAVLWDCSALESLGSLRAAKPSAVWATIILDLSHTSSHAVTGHSNGQAILWETKTRTIIHLIDLHRVDIYAFIVDNNGIVWSHGGDGIVIMSKVTMKGIEQIKSFAVGECVSSMAISKQHAFVGVRRKGLIVFDILTWKEIAVIKHTQVVQAIVIVIAPDNNNTNQNPYSLNQSTKQIASPNPPSPPKPATFGIAPQPTPMPTPQASSQSAIISQAPAPQAIAMPLANPTSITPPPKPRPSAILSWDPDDVKSWATEQKLPTAVVDALDGLTGAELVELKDSESVSELGLIKVHASRLTRAIAALLGE